MHGLGGIWWTLRHQLLALAEAGFHAVAVDLRGHGDSDKPPRGYDGWTLAEDVTNLIRALGHSTAVLVGHGEGGFVAWTAAYRRPGAVRALVVIGSGHPLAVRQAALREPAQRRTLMPGLLAHQIPRLPERNLTANGAEAVRALLRQRSSPRWTETEDFELSAGILQSAMLIPKVAHLSLESQRWMFRSQFRVDGRDFRRTVAGKLDLPALGICGAQDGYLFPATVAASRYWARNFHLAAVADAGHYPMMECPDETNSALVEFVSSLGEAL